MTLRSGCLRWWERVQRACHPESQGVRDRIAKPPERQFRTGAAGCDVVSQNRKQPRREWRTELFTPPDLLVECVGTVCRS
jgi:hypothetical protein